jgi:hypothetical protein
MLTDFVLVKIHLVKKTGMKHGRELKMLPKHVSYVHTFRKKTYLKINHVIFVSNQLT